MEHLRSQWRAANQIGPRFVHLLLSNDPYEAFHQVMGVAGSAGMNRRLSSVTPYDLSRFHETVGQGGFTHRPNEVDAPHSGFSTSVHPDFGGVGEVHDLAHFTPDAIARHREKISGLLEHGHGGAKVYQGGWLDRSAGKVYLDTSHVHEDEGKVRELATRNKQLAYFDLGKGQETYLDPTRDEDYRKGSPDAIAKYHAVQQKFGEITPAAYHGYEHEYPHPHADEQARTAAFERRVALLRARKSAEYPMGEARVVRLFGGLPGDR